jgi:hypothetical protein
MPSQGRETIIGEVFSPRYSGKFIVAPHHSYFNSAPDSKAPIGSGKSPLEDHRSILKNAFQTPEELSEPVFTMESSSQGSFSSAPSLPTILPSAHSPQAVPTIESFDSSRFSIFKDPKYDE